MPQPRRSPSSTRKPAAKAAATRKPAAKKATAKKPPARKPAAAKKKAPARKPAAKRSSRQLSPSAGLRENLLALRDRLMLTRGRIEDALDEAVERGRITRSDANDLVQDLVNRGRQETRSFMSDIEQLLGRSRDQIESATTRARKAKGADSVIRQVDRARRAAGVGPTFPVLGYDDLAAGQVVDRIGDLTPAELRKVRDYERRNANRKSVLSAIERALG
jgi:polyhydroxyalkanoate synthesis regulator phasin